MLGAYCKGRHIQVVRSTPPAPVVPVTESGIAPGADIDNFDEVGVLTAEGTELDAILAATDGRKG